MRLILIVPTPRESNGTSWGVSGYWLDSKWEVSWCCVLFLHAQRRLLYYIYCDVYSYIINFVV